MQSPSLTFAFSEMSTGTLDTVKTFDGGFGGAASGNQAVYSPCEPQFSMFLYGVVYTFHFNVKVF